MNTISASIAKAIDAHATELILLTYSIPFVAAYWYTRDQLIGTVLTGLIGGVLAISQKRAASTTNVENVEKVTVEGDDPDKTPKV